MTVSFEYNTAFLLVLFMFARLSASRERKHSRGEKREKKREEKEKEVGLQTELDISPVFSLAGDWVFCLWAVLLSGVDRGGEREDRCGVKG